MNASEENMEEKNENAAPPQDSFDLTSILFPTDFSPCCSGSALPHARLLAERLRVPLDVLYVHEETDTAGVTEAVLKKRFRSYLAKNNLLRLVRKVLIRVGSPAEEILKAAKESNASLIVMGTHGRTGLSHLVMGSVTENVLKRSLCPVYVVRQKVSE